MDTKSGAKQALMGLVLIAPALLLVVTGVLQSAGVVSDSQGRSLADQATGLLRGLYHPAVILGGLLLAFALNVRPVLRVDLKRQPQAIVGMVTVRGRLWNLVSVGLALGLLGAILAYAFVENFRVVPTHVAQRYVPTSEVRAWAPPEGTVWRLYDLPSDTSRIWVLPLFPTPVGEDP